MDESLLVKASWQPSVVHSFNIGIMDEDVLLEEVSLMFSCATGESILLALQLLLSYGKRNQ